MVAFRTISNWRLRKLVMGKDWDESAAAWIKSLGGKGDFGRRRVLDRPMLARLEKRRFGYALDVGCGEGRFCRMMRQHGIGATGLDPTSKLIDRAISLDREGDYILGKAEDIPFPDEHFELVVSYLSLIDIQDYRKAIAEMVRVLQPGGTLLVANMTSFKTAVRRRNIVRQWVGSQFGYPVAGYSEERANWESWRGIRVRNWHRPLSAYMQTFLGAGLELRHFDEPVIADPMNERELRYNEAPWFLIMEWQKPTTPIAAGVSSDNRR